MMTEDSEITFARRLGEVLGDMRAELDDKAIKRVLNFILARYGIDIVNNSLWIDARPRTPPPVAATISIQAVSAPPSQQPPIKLPTTQAPTEVAPLRDVAEVPNCPICGQDSFLGRAGLGGHMWQKHNIRMTEFVWPQEVSDDSAG